MLSAALNKRWQDNTSNNELYGNIPNITITIKEHRMRFSGHCWRSREETLMGNRDEWKKRVILCRASSTW